MRDGNEQHIITRFRSTMNFFLKFSKFNYNFSLCPFHFSCSRLAFNSKSIKAQ